MVCVPSETPLEETCGLGMGPVSVSALSTRTLPGPVYAAAVPEFMCVSPVVLEDTVSLSFSPTSSYSLCLLTNSLSPEGRG